MLQVTKPDSFQVRWGGATWTQLSSELCERSPLGSGRTWTPTHRQRSHQYQWDQRIHGLQPERPSVCEVSDWYGLLGHSGKGWEHRKHYHATSLTTPYSSLVDCQWSPCLEEPSNLLWSFTKPSVKALLNRWLVWLLNIRMKAIAGENQRPQKGQRHYNF